ncbi:type II glyceraldehyde-3-phosphate dehydrogenase [archaeon]|nr:type II glyceraldehyde-3-phosphate dehydrogenase [archaeon]
MGYAKIAVNGYGTVGRRVGTAVNAQYDMEIVGVVKTRPTFEAMTAIDKGFDLYVPDSDMIGAFEKAGIEVAGTLDDLLDKVEIVVDCTPNKVGASYKSLYVEKGVKAIWQGGEAHELAEFSFNAEANYDDAIDRNLARVVSCNTTGLTRALYPLEQEYGVEKARATLIRRAADPGQSNKGPINAIVPALEMPSHHGPDVNTIMPNIEIATTAVKVPSTLMHLHGLTVALKNDFEPEDIVDLYEGRPRIYLVSGGDGVSDTAKIMELSKELGRSRNDMFENAIWKDSISKYQGELYLFQAIHQESDIVPENVDAIRAMCGLESDGAKSIAMTNKKMGIGK